MAKKRIVIVDRNLLDSYAYAHNRDETGARISPLPSTRSPSLLLAANEINVVIIVSHTQTHKHRHIAARQRERQRERGRSVARERIRKTEEK